MSVPSLFLKLHEIRNTLFHSQWISVWKDDIVQKTHLHTWPWRLRRQGSERRWLQCLPE